MDSPFSDMDWLDTAGQTLDTAIEKGLFDQFRQCQSDFDRVQFMSEHVVSLLSKTFERYLSKSSSSSSSTVCLNKDATRAVQFRKQGNDYFVNKNLSTAAWCYRMSIALSAANSQDMALSYGNLSAVLFELNRYHESIRAIQLASDHYPNELKFKLVFRRAACYHKLNDPERSSEELKVCRDLIKQTTGLDRKKIEAFCKEMDQLSQQTILLTQKKEEEERRQKPFQNLDDLVESSNKPSELFSEAIQTTNKSKKFDNEDFRPPSPPSPPRTTSFFDSGPTTNHLHKGENSMIPCASSTLRVIYSKDKGRHIIATEDIPAGAFILIERPYACLLLPKFAYTYCDYCLTIIVIPYVCTNCAHVLFCSEHCQQQALSGYHRYECSYIHVLKTLGVGFLAYRTLTSTNVDIVREILNMDLRNPLKFHDRNNSYQSDYYSVQRLITHTEHMSSDDLFHYSLTAYFLSEMIYRTGFITSSGDEQIRVATILLKHIQQMICNAQTISINAPNQDQDIVVGLESVKDHANQSSDVVQEHQQPKDKRTDEQFDDDDDDPLNKRFASAIFPTCALMNHSCVPNIQCVFDRGYLHVQTARRIRKGEEIYNCYGPQKSLMPSIEQRQSILFEQYFFKCQCEACSADQKSNNNREKPMNGYSQISLLIVKQENTFAFVDFLGRKLKSSKKNGQQRTNINLPSSSNSALNTNSNFVENHIQDDNQFYQITSEKLIEARLLFSQSLSSFSQDQTSWETNLALLESSIRLYERIIRDINLDTVHLYESVASMYNDQQQFELTCSYLHKCISILKMNLSGASSSNNTILLVDVLRKYAQTLFNCRKFDDARRTIAEAQSLLDRISPMSLNDEDPSNSHVLKTMEDLKAKCDLCIG